MRRTACHHFLRPALRVSTQLYLRLQLRNPEGRCSRRLPARRAVCADSVCYFSLFLFQKPGQRSPRQPRSGRDRYRGVCVGALRSPKPVPDWRGRTYAESARSAQKRLRTDPPVSSADCKQDRSHSASEHRSGIHPGMPQALYAQFERSSHPLRSIDRNGSPMRPFPISRHQFCGGDADARRRRKTGRRKALRHLLPAAQEAALSSDFPAASSFSYSGHLSADSCSTARQPEALS